MATPDFERRRSDLFLAALRLHDIALRLNASELRRFIYPAKRVLSGQEKLSSEQLVRVWNTLFFLSPVISTTLASVQKLPMQTGWIGHVLIDEAGQATPQSVVGVLQRARKATIVGDPLQIEPVFTVPTPVIERLREKHAIEKRFSPTWASAQTLADGVMVTGAWVDQEGEKHRVWTGMPLRVHRRCSEPMFSIANRIAYDNQMVQGVMEYPELECDPGQSVWYDVRGQSAVMKVVSEEMEELEVRLTRIRDGWPMVAGGARQCVCDLTFCFGGNAGPAGCPQGNGTRCLDALSDRDRAQVPGGREADIVFLVLGGSHPGSRGEKVVGDGHRCAQICSTWL